MAFEYNAHRPDSYIYIYTLKFGRAAWDIRAFAFRALIRPDTRSDRYLRYLRASTLSGIRPDPRSDRYLRYFRSSTLTSNVRPGHPTYVQIHDPIAIYGTCDRNCDRSCDSNRLTISTMLPEPRCHLIHYSLCMYMHRSTLVYIYI